MMNNDVSREIGADLDRQQKQIDYSAAGQEVQNQNMREERQANELQGYGQMMNVGMGMKYGGLSNIYNSFANTENMAMQAFGGGAGTGNSQQIQLENRSQPWATPSYNPSGLAGNASLSGGFGYGWS